jgi:uncharacterized OB-fold protein
LNVTGQVVIDPELFRLSAEVGGRPSLLASYAEQSGLTFWPRRRRCPVTGAPVRDVELSPTGILYAWTFLHVSRMGQISYGSSGGYAVGQIDMPEGVRVQAPVRGTPDDWSIGDEFGLTTLAVGIDDDGRELVTFQFEAIR